MFKCYNSLASPHLSSHFYEPSHRYSTCNSNLVNLPPVKSSYGQRLLSFFGVSLWRSLPVSIHNSDSLMCEYLPGHKSSVSVMQAGVTGTSLSNYTAWKWQLEKKNLISPWWNTTSELQCGFVPKETNTDTKNYMKPFKDSASTRNHRSSSTIERVPNDILLTDTALQHLEVIIHHGKIKPLGGWLAFATRTLGKLGHSMLTHCYRYQL